MGLMNRNSVLHTVATLVQNSAHAPTLWAEPPFLPESRQLFEAAAARTSGLVILVFSLQTGFSSARIHLVIKPMFIIEPAVP